MTRPYAFSVIAVVTNEHSLGDWSVINLPRNSVSRRVSSWISEFKLSVALFIFCANPFPTIIGLFDLRPKSRFDGNGRAS